ncbi:MAG: hypothetical protein HOO96_35015, partial [Polyangiaceae bacterium]|nr:hypothetical protein [Polyangiaceae bacterium]
MPSPRLFLATLLASLTLAGSAAAHDDDGAKAQTEHAPSAAEGDAKEAEAE